MLLRATSVPETQRAGSVLACMNGPETNRMLFRRRRKQLRTAHGPRLLLKAHLGPAGRSRQSRQFLERTRCLKGGRGTGVEQAARRGADRGQEARRDAGREPGARVGRAHQCPGKTRDVDLAQDPGQDQDQGTEEEEGGMIQREAVEEEETCLPPDLAVLRVAPCHLS